MILQRDIEPNRNTRTLGELFGQEFEGGEETEVFKHLCWPEFLGHTAQLRVDSVQKFGGPADPLRGVRGSFGFELV